MNEFYQPTPPLKAIRKAPIVSVIIPALNEEKMIGACFEHLIHADFSRNNFEVILVDNCSSDRTVEIAEDFASTVNLRILSKAETTIGALRNIGAKAAQGEILAFLDADCLAPKEWLRNAAELFKQKTSALLGAHYAIPADSSWVARAWFGRQKDKVGATSYLPGGDLLIRASDFFQLGGFDESLQTNEDYELCQRALAAGFSVQAMDALIVCHLGTPQTIIHFYRKQYWQGTHVFTVFLRSLPQLKNTASVLFALYILLCGVGLVSSAILAFFSGELARPFMFATAIALAALLSSIRSAIARGKAGEILPLAFLYLVFGAARALCLLRIRDIYVGFGSGSKLQSPACEHQP